MKNLKNCCIHDYQSGALIGYTPVDLSLYDLWKEGPSEVAKAKNVLTKDDLNTLEIDGETTIFVLEWN